MAEHGDNAKKVSFKDSLNLPTTAFPIRPNAKEDDAAMLERWQEEHLYEKAFFKNQGSKKFIAVDGPPYANGNIHLGHAYNKILKDIATKSRRMMGMQVPVIPGWDCHGLPIEHRVSNENPDLSRPALITACREYAQKWVNIQKEEFKKLGVLMDWDRPYLTMSPTYEAKELEALGIFVERGYISRSNKTVPWCPSCKTVLATAEIEYQERKDPSIYVRFELAPQDAQKLFSEISAPISAVAWTTTPWTLVLNRALIIKPDTKYVLLDVNGQYLLVGAALADKLCSLLEVEKNIIKEVQASELAGLQAQHPFIDDLTVPIIADDMVQTDEGTAFVHCGPGCGPEDYETAIKHGLEVYSPVTQEGTYSQEVAPKELAGMKISDAQIWVIKKLAGNGKLLYKTSLRHPYPHCWRCRNGLIFRATKQWFFSLTHNDLKKRALEATEAIATLPEKSINRLQATIDARWEWCISRQRAWGVPIPALICTACDQALINRNLIEKVAQGVRKEGIMYWENVQVADLLDSDTACGSCDGSDFKKEQDILDVWFDAGLSHFVVYYDNPEQAYPADLYLEGRDQHRGFFQSSLLTSMALEEQAAMKMIITHGFTVDAKGIKMSKSIGNVVSPQEIIDKLGTDGLRLWASSIDFASDAVVSPNLIQNVQEVFRKVRNTCRFLLSNLYDFDIETDAVPLEQMRTIDQHALQELYEFNGAMLGAYENYDFTALFHKFGEYCSVNLSSFYLEIVKDCLYVEKADGHARRSVQTACWHILDTLTRLMAPVFSFTAEQVSDLYQKEKTESIHLQRFNLLPDVWNFLALENHAPDDMQKSEGVEIFAYEPMMVSRRMVFIAEQANVWDLLKSIRSAILKETELLREKSEIKRSLDAKVTIHFDPRADWHQQLSEFIKRLEQKGEKPEEFFKELAILSQLSIAGLNEGLTESGQLPGLYVKAEKAAGVKCPRCWQWSESNHELGLCDRCAQLV